jgi:hypothetical protein
MAWFGKDDKSGNKKDKQAAEGAGRKSPVGQKDSASKSQRPDSNEIRAQALANMRSARDRLGEETIKKIAEAIQKKQNSPTERAKAQINKIAETEADRVAEEILSMLETRH